MSKPLQIRLLDTKEWINKETAPQIAPLKEKANSLLKEVKERIDDTIQSGQRILENSESEMNKNNPKTYRFARNASKFAQNLTETIEWLTLPDSFSYEKIHTFCTDLEKAFATLAQLRYGAYPYISPYFIFDRRRLDVSYKRLYDITKELRGFLTTKYEKAKTIEDTHSISDKLLKTVNEAKQNQENKKLIEEREKTLEKEIAATQQNIAGIQTKAELNELVKLNQKTEELRENVKHGLRYLQKPFFKLQSLARTGEVTIPLDEMNKLGDYLSDPFMALATDEDGYLLLKGIVKKLDATIAQGKLKLKSTRLRKAQDQINAILNNISLGQLQKNCKEAFSQRGQLLALETITALQDQLTQLQNHLKELQKENEFVSSKSKTLESEQGKLGERAEYLKKELEKSIFQLTNKKAQIVLSA